MKRGQALIETLVAVSVLTIGFMGLVNLLARSLSLNRVVADNYTATYLAAEGIEVVKNIMDSNYLSGDWKNGLTTGTFEVEYDSLALMPNQQRFLNFDDNSKIYSYDAGKSTRFRRWVDLKVGSDDIQVNSYVRWTTRGGGTFEINLEDRFLDWRKYSQE